MQVFDDNIQHRGHLRVNVVLIVVLSQGEAFESHQKKAKVKIQEVDVAKYARSNQVIKLPLPLIYIHVITLRKRCFTHQKNRALK